MDQRLMKLLQTAVFKDESFTLDTYNQSVQYDCSCTIRTNINTANHHFIMEKLIEPYNTDIEGNCCCLKANYYKMAASNFVGHTKDGFKATCVMEKINVIGQISSSQNSRVIDSNGISYAMTNGEKDGTPKIIEPISCAMRGRNPNNPSERGRSNGTYKQRVEMGSNISNTITSAQKDSLVAEPLKIRQATEQGYIEVPPGSVFDGGYPNSKTRRGRLQDGGQTSPTLTSQGEPPLFYEGIKTYNNEERRLFEEHNKTNSGEVLCILQQKVGKETYKWAIGRFRCILKEEILRYRLHEESICEARKQGSSILPGSSFFKEDSVSDSRETDDVRDMWLHKKYRCTSQGHELSEQFSREFNDIVQKLSHENASSKKIMSNLWRTCILSRPLQQTLLEIEKIWKSIDSKPQVSFRIRKLTEREVFRLMGVSETDIDKIQSSGVSRSQQYRMAGNSIVVDVLYHIFRKMFVEKGQESQQLSLF